MLKKICYFQHLSGALAEFTSGSHSSLSSSMLSCNILLQRYMKRYCSIAYDFKLWCLQPMFGTTSSADVAFVSATRLSSPAAPLLLFCFSRGTFCLGWQLPQKVDGELRLQDLCNMTPTLAVFQAHHRWRILKYHKYRVWSPITLDSLNQKPCKPTPTPPNDANQNSASFAD